MPQFHYVIYMNTTSERQAGCVFYIPVHKSIGEKLHNQNKPNSKSEATKSISLIFYCILGIEYTVHLRYDES